MKFINIESKDGLGGYLIPDDETGRKIAELLARDGYIIQESAANIDSYHKLNQEQEKWFKIWFTKKCGSDHLFPTDMKEWLRLAFRAGYNAGDLNSRTE